MFLLTSAALSSAANQARVPVTGETGGAKGSENGTAWPSARFVVEGGSISNCVRDQLTGLMWVRDLSTVKINGGQNGVATPWQNALDSVNGGYCGYTDWRLPNINELKSLLNYGDKISPASWLNRQNFVNVLNNGYWSSTSYASDTSYAWFINFSSGFVVASSKNLNAYVWPVRRGR